ncbi:hypothetical protein JNM05_09050, partial [bacterium]|nr:hypothetical protein [bacterium]
NSLGSHSSGKSEAPQSEESLVIQVGKTVYFGSEDLSIFFESVPMDCRCPEGAMCVWAGYVEIALKAEKKGWSPIDLTLSTLNGNLDSVSFLGYSLHLIAVTPYPSIDHERDSTAYKAELILRKLP